MLPLATTPSGAQRVLLLARRFDGSAGRTWYPGHDDWRGGSIRNFVGDSCVVAAFATVRPLGVVAVDNRSFQFVDDCGSSQPWHERARLEDARAIVRADGSYALVYTRVGRREAHVMHSVPLVVDATARTARAALERRVELCTALLDRLGESTFQKNWAPFSYGGRDYVVYSIAPLRVWRVDHDTGACEVAAATPAPALEALVRNCSAIDAIDGHAAQTEAWRRCTGSRQQFPKAGRTLRRATLSLAGGTPGVAVAPRDLGLGGEAPVLVFAGHSKLTAASAALLERIEPCEEAEAVGPDGDWHCAYSKLYLAFLFVLAPTPTGGGGVRFELSHVSRLFRPRGTRLRHPKISYPSGLLAPPTAQSARRRLVLFFGEVDVYSHASALPLPLRPGALSAVGDVGAAGWQLVGRWSDVVDGSPATTDLSPALYAAPPPYGAAAASSSAAPARTCRSLGFQVTFNFMLLPIRGAPVDRAAPGRRCAPLTERAAATALECCELCQAQGDACRFWSYFAPTCYWSTTCKRTLANAQLMYGAVSGVRRNFPAKKQSQSE